MKVYISGKISTKENYQEDFLKAKEKLERMGHTVLSPLMINASLEYEEYMHIDFSMIDICDAVYFLYDWSDSRGARREKSYAEAKEKLLMFEDYPDSE